MKRVPLLILLIALFVPTAIAQGGLTGRVVEALDGRTLILETAAGRITAQLQYVEVPEDGQPLFSITRDHLAHLAVDKFVELKPQRIVRSTTIGRVTLGGVDLSLQMIRDGAAWHEPKETSGQSLDEAADYEANQALAKNEKRGVWSGAILKTPWEVRAEKDQTQRAIETARRIARPTPVGVDQFHSDTRRRAAGPNAPKTVTSRMQMDAWVGVLSESAKEAHGLLTFSDPKSRFTMVYTSATLIDLVSPAGKERLEYRTLMIAPTLYNGGRNQIYLVGLGALASDYRFTKGRSSLTVLVDKQRLALGAPFGWRGQGFPGAYEVLLFRVTWAQLKKIANAKNVEVRIDKLTGPLPESARHLTKQLVEATQ